MTRGIAIEDLSIRMNQKEGSFKALRYNRDMKGLSLVLLFVILASFLFTQSVDAHKNDCHRSHSCPSDTGSYICGDYGSCSGCRDNQYCKNGVRVSITGNQISKKITVPQRQVIPSGLCKGNALCYIGKIKKIKDGDTLVIDKYTIRLALANTPEYYQTGSSEATSFTQKLCPVGSIATVDQDDVQKLDTYGRVLAVVYCQGKNLNQQLLQNKHAKILKDFCRKSEFKNEPWAVANGC